MRTLHVFTLVILGISAILPVNCLAAMDIAKRESLRKVKWPGDESDWIRKHAGIIFYDDGPGDQYKFDEQIDMAHALGTPHIKTWLKGYKPGEMREKLDLPRYKRVCSEFDTVLFDACPDYVSKGDYDEKRSEEIRKDYEDVAYYLASEYRGQKRTFLISLFMETNLFFGTQRAPFPDMPVLKFFEDAGNGVKAGIKRARAEKIAGDIPKIYTVIEIAGLPKDYIDRYFPKTHADLYAISYYHRGELGQPDTSLQDCIDYVSKRVPHDGPFGKNNLILGELGRNVFYNGNEGNDREQIDYLRKTLSIARKNHFQYAFIFWLNDQERMKDDGWGYVSSKPTGGVFRRAWYLFQSIYGGKTTGKPEPRQMPKCDAVSIKPYNPEPGEMVNISFDISNRSTWEAPAAPVKNLRIKISAGNDIQENTISLAADEVLTLRTKFHAPENGNISLVMEAPEIEQSEKTISLERADLIIEKVYMEPANPKPGENARPFAVVKNIGKKPLTDFAVHFHIDDFKDLWVSWGCIYGETVLKPGMSIPIGGGFTWKATPGKHKIRAWANPDGSHESDYSNNICYGEFGE